MKDIATVEKNGQTSRLEISNGRGHFGLCLSSNYTADRYVSKRFVPFVFRRCLVISVLMRRFGRFALRGTFLSFGICEQGILHVCRSRI